MPQLDLNASLKDILQNLRWPTSDFLPTFNLLKKAIIGSCNR